LAEKGPAAAKEQASIVFHASKLARALISGDRRRIVPADEAWLDMEAKDHGDVGTTVIGIDSHGGIGGIRALSRYLNMVY
jgi:hypothetical protein